MVRGLLERLFDAEKIDAWFENVREVQYIRNISFSSLVSIMLQVVCRVRSNVYSAYLNSDIDATRQAVYDKLKNIETKMAREIVRYMADESELIIREMKGAQPPLLSRLKTKFLDGNCIEATEHRLKPLRETQAGALPGKALVVFEPELGVWSRMINRFFLKKFEFNAVVLLQFVDWGDMAKIFLRNVVII